MVYLFECDFFFFLPELYLIFVLLLMFLFCSCLFNVVFYYNKYVNFVFIIVINSILMLVFYGLLIFNFFDLKLLLFNGVFFIDNFILFFKIFIVLISVIFLLLSWSYIFYDFIQKVEFLFILDLCFIVAFLIIASNDFISLYLLIELLSLALYVLICYKIYDNYSLEAGLKYFILSVLASIFFLIGYLYLYWGNGLWLFDNVVLFNINFINFEYLLCLVPFFFFFFFKLSIFPFHYWVNDVYEGIYDFLVLVFSTFVKILFYFVFFKFVFVFWQYIILLSNFIKVISLMSIVVGIFGAMYQTKIKRFWGFSSITNLGFVLLTITLFDFMIVKEVVIFYFVIYISINILYFSLILGLRDCLYNYVTLKNFSDFVYIKSHNIIISWFFSIVFFSLLSIPPLSGFFSKYFLFYVLGLNQEYFIVLLLCVVSVLSSFYYLKVIKVLNFNIVRSYRFYKFDSTINAYLSSFLCCFNLFLFLDPSILLDIIGFFTIEL